MTKKKHKFIRYCPFLQVSLIIFRDISGGTMASSETEGNEETITKRSVQEGTKVFSQIIEEEMKKSFLDYSMSVIVSRALPDVRDGLKPVHRRILFAMHEVGLQPGKKFRKSATVVGEVLGKYHPHGDAAVYEAMVRMAQPWSLRYPLVWGQGNFGSVDGDSAAAMRYTEAKMEKITEELLTDIKKDTVDWADNFDASLKEPLALPARAPNLLLNGSTGIAVGMATSIPPHNLKEACDAIAMVVDNPEIDIASIISVLPGPDFPTGGIIKGKSGIHQAYTTGHGRLRIHSRMHVEETQKRTAIIIDELPYTVNKASLIEEIAEAVKSGKIEGIHDIRDESDRHGMRIVIELKKDASSDVVENQLTKHSKVSITFTYHNLVLVNGEPKILDLKTTIQHYIDHRVTVIMRRTQYELGKARDRAHILEGLIIALSSIDAIVSTIKESKNIEAARAALMAQFTLSEKQANAILEMKLSKLTSLETQSTRDELEELRKQITYYEGLLASKEKILGLIKEDLHELKERYGDERRTQIVEAEEDIDLGDLIEPEDVVLTVSHAGYVKRTPLALYREQHRGGRGITASTTREEDFIEQLFVSNTHDYLLVFTNKGKIHWLKVYQIPEGSRQAKGKPIVNLLPLDAEEQVATMMPVKRFEEGYLLFATKQGTVKKTALKDYSRPRSGGIRALSLDEGDQLINVLYTTGSDELLIATKKGNAVRFSEQDVRSMGRQATGVRGVRLEKDDALIGIAVARAKQTLLTITENGFGKRTPVEDYRLIHRGGSGVINIKCTPRNGDVVAVQCVRENDSLMLISRKGVMIRTGVDTISTIGRNTQGVRVMRLDDRDRVVSVARIEDAD